MLMQPLVIDEEEERQLQEKLSKLRQRASRDYKSRDLPLAFSGIESSSGGATTLFGGGGSSSKPSTTLVAHAKEKAAHDGEPSTTTERRRGLSKRRVDEQDGTVVAGTKARADSVLLHASASDSRLSKAQPGDEKRRGRRREPKTDDADSAADDLLLLAQRHAATVAEAEREAAEEAAAEAAAEAARRKARLRLQRKAQEEKIRAAEEQRAMEATLAVKQQAYERLVEQRKQKELGRDKRWSEASQALRENQSARQLAEAEARARREVMARARQAAEDAQKAEAVAAQQAHRALDDEKAEAGRAAAEARAQRVTREMARRRAQQEKAQRQEAEVRTLALRVGVTGRPRPRLLAGGPGEGDKGAEPSEARADGGASSWLRPLALQDHALDQLMSSALMPLGNRRDVQPRAASCPNLNLSSGQRTRTQAATSGAGGGWQVWEPTTAPRRR